MRYHLRGEYTTEWPGMLRLGGTQRTASNGVAYWSNYHEIRVGNLDRQVSREVSGGGVGKGCSSGGVNRTRIDPFGGLTLLSTIGNLRAQILAQSHFDGVDVWRIAVQPRTLLSPFSPQRAQMWISESDFHLLHIQVFSMYVSTLPRDKGRFVAGMNTWATLSNYGAHFQTIRPPLPCK